MNKLEELREIIKESCDHYSNEYKVFSGSLEKVRKQIDEIEDEIDEIEDEIDEIRDEIGHLEDSVDYIKSLGFELQYTSIYFDGDDLIDEINSKKKELESELLEKKDKLTSLNNSIELLESEEESILSLMHSLETNIEEYRDFINCLTTFNEKHYSLLLEVEEIEVEDIE